MRITQSDIPYTFKLPIKYRIVTYGSPIKYRLEVMTRDGWSVYRTLGTAKSIVPITQRFGQNLVPFYSELGLLGHQGIDWMAQMYSNIYSIYDGTVVGWSDSWGGLSIETETFTVSEQQVKLEIRYGHLWEPKVEVGQRVKQGDLIALSDNRGQYTTAAHLHLDITPLYFNSRDRWNRDEGNGYAGAIDYEQKMETIIINYNNMPLIEQLEAEKQKQIWLADFKRKHDTQLVRNSNTGEFGWFYADKLRILKDPDRGTTMLLSYLHRKDKCPTVCQADWDKFTLQEF